jgi:hypothetical protein
MEIKKRGRKKLQESNRNAKRLLLREMKISSHKLEDFKNEHTSRDGP